MHILNRLLQDKSVRLFLISFLALYLELVYIRWLSSYVLYLGYFTNFVLLGCLLGIGAGVMLGDRPRRYIQWLPLLMFVIFTLVLITRAQVAPDYEDFIYFTNNTTNMRLPPQVLLPLIFAIVTVSFTCLAQEIGVLLPEFPALRAYSLNIIGSLAGIAVFTGISFLSWPSWAWITIAVLVLIPFLPAGRWRGHNIILLLGLGVIVAAADVAFGTVWSPYSRLNLVSQTGVRSSNSMFGGVQPGEDAYTLVANGVGHQAFTTLEKSEPFYQMPYLPYQGKKPPENALIIGAGGGNDVAFALENGVAQVDAVEIDPSITKLGASYHPEAPYSDARVTLYIDDARSYLKKTDRRYDLIIFALPDSLVLATTASSIRLESFLFTQEAFVSVKEHLQPGGLFVLYNYYRYDWLLEKIAVMLQDVFHEAPLVYRYPDDQGLSSLAVIFSGGSTDGLDLGGLDVNRLQVSSYLPATDNWPFLYMKEPGLPYFYTLTLLVILVFAGGYVRILSPVGAIQRHGLPFFFMGAAFTMLEVKSIVQFLLLFGATWLVNSMVFFAILAVVLVANLIASRYHFRKVGWLYALLILALLLNYYVPLRVFLIQIAWLRYLVVTAFIFSPIFIANLIYSNAFRDTSQVNLAFGANLLGSIVGGALEYFALLTGYRALVLFAGCFYLVAFFAFTRLRKVTPEGAG